MLITGSRFFEKDFGGGVALHFVDFGLIDPLNQFSSDKEGVVGGGEMESIFFSSVCALEGEVLDSTSDLTGSRKML